jgi:hypothetical protein
VLSHGRSRAALGRLIGAALLALLLAQWTALTHAVAHAPLGVAVAVEVDDDGRWGHEADTPSCELIDHLLLGQSTPRDAPAMAWLQHSAALAATPNRPIVCGATLRAYEARGPPEA